MLRLDGVEVSYGAVRAVSDLSLDVAPGEVVALVGANGAGKSSTLKAILGLVKASGHIRLDGEDVSGKPAHLRVAAGLALSPEGRHVFPQMSVRENLELGTVKRTSGATKELLEEMMTIFPRLRERIRQRAGSMSGGEQQMLAIARALMSRPKVLMLDEPTLGLAPLIVDQIGDLVGVLKKRGLSILLSEQNAEMALDVADRAYVLETGRIVKSGESQIIKADPAVRSAYLGFAEEPA
ncbi:ABC transporter ATP-binding protein [Bradyrhizobium neotropicale]|uniref:ABC transporter ATP-binding protein n=1 Tax=Bradyrhizobium neotropicale TaxID=1497615 RepID=UPI001AD78C6E|nr:ABC transporter ATP-binding protein [Bradyrhizobium neotropicale]MBO4226837.1 ATP-binding cassette domain-containing protein [Bradyrhizobium neotropicale]